jgi:copper homeostasis protein
MAVSKEIVIEVCATSIMSAIAAQKGGAKRIELCDNIIEGGTTPGAASISMCKKHLDIDICVLIRPRGGDFLYNDYEFQQIIRDIEFAKDLGADGIVVGVLDKSGLVDTKKMESIIEASGSMEVVFHRAFDMCSDPYIAIKQLMELGVDRLLTSGQRNTAIEGADLIRGLISIAGNSIEIMPGSGINPDNIVDLISKTGAGSYHLTGRSSIKSEMEFIQKKVRLTGMNNLSDYEWLATDENIIKKIVELSKSVTSH